MPFDFKKYDAKCAAMDGDALQREWEHYTRLISGAATSTAVSGMAVPFTLGVSAIGVGLAAPAIHNARKKREIIERHPQRLGRTHHTRKRDVITAGAISGTVGVATLGLAPVGADAICNSAAEHGIAYIAENELGVKIATHLALDAAAVAAEETHMHSKKEQEAWKAYGQAVREGKNPSLPNSDLKIPATTTNQPQYHMASPQTTPSIQVVPPLDRRVSVGATPGYFPPSPSQTDLKVNNPVNHQHSTLTTYNMPQQMSAYLPPPTPPPPYYVQPEGMYMQQQYQTQTQRPRALSTGSFDRPQTHEMQQQVQPYVNAAQSPPPLSPRPPPSPLALASSPSPVHTPTTTITAYSASPAPATNSTFPHQSPYNQTTSVTHQPTWSTQYDPNNYVNLQEKQRPSFHAPAQLVYSVQDTHRQMNDLKYPLVSEYRVQDTTPPTGAPTYNPTPIPQPQYSYPPEKPAAQQIPYFPPPPTAY